MFHVGDGNVDPRHLRHLPRIAARRIDDDLGADSALVGDDVPLAGGKLGQPGDQGLADDRRAKVLRADRHRVAQPRRVGVAVAGRIGPRNHPVGGHERVDPADLFGADDLHVEADILRIAMDIFHPRKLALVGRQADTARPVPADILAGQFLQPGIEVVAVGVDLGEVIAAGDARALPCGVPRRPRGQLVLFDQQAIGPAQFGQMIEQRGTHDAPADDHDPCACLHHRPVLGCQWSGDAKATGARCTN